MQVPECSQHDAPGVEGRTKAIAEKSLLARIEQLRGGADGAHADTTLGDLVRSYVQDIRDGMVPTIQAERRESTYESIARVWCLSEPYKERGERKKGKSNIDKTRITELRPGDLNREVTRLAQLGGTSQMKHIRALWSAACQRAVDDEVILHNPVRDMARLPTADSDARVYKNGSARGKRDVLDD